MYSWKTHNKSYIILLYQKKLTKRAGREISPAMQKIEDFAAQGIEDSIIEEY